MLIGDRRAGDPAAPLSAPGTKQRAAVQTPARLGMSRAAPYALRTSRPAIALVMFPFWWRHLGLQALPGGDIHWGQFRRV